MKGSITRTIRFNPEPIPGKDAVLYRLVPSHTSVAIRRVDGELVPDVENITVRVTKQVGDDTPTTVAPANWDSEDLFVTYTFDYGSEFGVLAPYPSASGLQVDAEAKSLTIILRKNRVVVDNVTIPFICDGEDGEPGKPGNDGKPGEKGSRGPTLRGPQYWKDVPVGYPFQSGAEGESFIDVVLYGPNDDVYVCKGSHTKASNNGPSSSVSATNGYWELGTKFEVVATKILLAQYALIKNLGVEVLEMKDADGNILCLIKDGQVICNTGEFKNINVQGNITADTLCLKISTADDYAYPNGSLLLNKENILLPDLPPFTTCTLKLMNPLRSRTPGVDLVLECDSPTCAVTLGLDVLNATQMLTVPSAGTNSGRMFELMGINEFGTGTTWFLIETKFK